MYTAASSGVIQGDEHRWYPPPSSMTGPPGSSHRLRVTRSEPAWSQVDRPGPSIRGSEKKIFANPSMVCAPTRVGGRGHTGSGRLGSADPEDRSCREGWPAGRQAG